MKTYLLLLSAVTFLVGCSSVPYNPVTASTAQVFLLNETSLAQVKIGMKQEQVHQIMGEGVVIGYSYKNAVVTEATVAKAQESDYKPLTIANPYKIETIVSKEGSFTVEYYADLIKQSDGVVSDNELVPLIFQAGILVSRGWDALKALRLKNPS